MIQRSKSIKKKKSPPEEPWRKYDKSYARLSARTPANNNNNNNNDAADNNAAAFLYRLANALD